MKIIGTFGLVVTVGLGLLQPAQGGSRGSGHSSFSAQHYYSVPAAHYSHYSSAPRSYSAGAARYYSAARFSSGATFRNRSYSYSGPRLSVNRTTALNPRTYSASRQTVNRTAALRSQALNTNSSREVARYGSNWH